VKKKKKRGQLGRLQKKGGEKGIANAARSNQKGTGKRGRNTEKRGSRGESHVGRGPKRHTIKKEKITP